MNRTPTPEVSQKVLGAIEAALDEEQVSLPRRALKIILAATFCALVSVAPIFVLFWEFVDSGFWAAGMVWWLCLVIGFSLYYYPQPRLAVPGFLAPWVLSKVMILMSLMTAVTLLVCPSFVFIHGTVPWSNFEIVSLWLMRQGGMRLCMFGCGLLFSLPSAFVALSVVLKTLSGSSVNKVAGIVALAFFTQAPIIILQMWSEALRPFVLFWAGGSLLAIVAGGLILKLILGLRLAINQKQ